MNTENIHITEPANEITEIVCIIDRSGSMFELSSKTIEGYNSFLQEQQHLPGIANWTLCLFDGDRFNQNSYEIVIDSTPIQNVPKLTTSSYITGGTTAMYDAIGATLTNVYNKVKNQSNTKVIVMIVTDGEENSSKEYNQSTVFKMIKERQELDKWGFIFAGANIDTMQAGEKMSMSKGNTMSFSASDDSVTTAYTNISASIKNYRSLFKKDLNDTDLDTLLSNNGMAKENIKGN